MWLLVLFFFFLFFPVDRRLTKKASRTNRSVRVLFAAMVEREERRWWRAMGVDIAFRA